MRQYEEDGYLVTEYDSGSIVRSLISEETIPNPEELLVSLKLQKQEEFNRLCESEIESGFELELSGITKHYDFDRDTQLNMLGLQSKIIFNVINGTPLTNVSWYASKEPCEDYTVNDFLTLCAYGEQFKTALIEKCKMLKAQLKKCTTIEQVEAIAW